MTEHSPTNPIDAQDTRTVFERLIAVRKQVGAVRKEQRNTAPGANYNFRGIDAVVNATAAALIEHGVSIVPRRVVRMEQGQVTYGGRDSRSQFTRVIVRFRVYGLRGDSFTVEAAGEAFDSGDKATPKASSVAHRTALIELLHLPTDEPDPDSFTYGHDEPAHPTELDMAKTDAWTLTGEKLGYAPAVHGNRVTLLRQAIEAVGGTMESENPGQWDAAAKWIGEQL